MKILHRSVARKLISFHSALSQQWLLDRIKLAISSPVVAKTIASTHCDYPRRDDSQAESAWVAGYIPRWYAHPKMVAHPTTNWTQFESS